MAKLLLHSDERIQTNGYQWAINALPDFSIDLVDVGS